MLCIWTFIHIGRPQDIFTFLIPFHIGDITAAVTILSYYFTAQHRPQIRLYPEVRLFILFLGLAALSAPFGYFPRKSLYFLIDFGGKVGIYLWLIAKLITTEERIQGVLKTLMFSGVAMATSAILRAGTGGRIGGGAYDPNDLALVLVTTLPIAIMEGLSTPSIRWKIVCIGGAILNLIGIIATQSRGGFLGLVGLGGFMTIVKLPGISKKKIILIISVLAVIFGTYLGTEYKERIQTIFEETTSDITAGSGRIGVWRRALQIAREHPFLGVGPSAFGTAYGHYLETDRFSGALSKDVVGGAWKTAHNSFLLVLTEMGLPGLLIFLSINARSLRNFQSIKAHSQNHSVFDIISVQATALQIALVGFLVCAFFLSQSYNPLIYLFLFLSGAMIRTGSTVKSREGPSL
jgi:probable O-glycosylation ligase (exosortase A-associated)